MGVHAAALALEEPAAARAQAQTLRVYPPIRPRSSLRVPQELVRRAFAVTPASEGRHRVGPPPPPTALCRKLALCAALPEGKVGRRVVLGAVGAAVEHGEQVEARNAQCPGELHVAAKPHKQAMRTERSGRGRLQELRHSPCTAQETRTRSKYSNMSQKQERKIPPLPPPSPRTPWPGRRRGPHSQLGSTGTHSRCFRLRDGGRWHTPPTR